jgi:hypothetical protein
VKESSPVHGEDARFTPIEKSGGCQTSPAERSGWKEEVEGRKPLGQG